MFGMSEKLRSARLDQNLSLRELATRAEVSASLLSQIENGKANPSVRSLYSIADALSLPVDYFFPAENDEKNEVGLPPAAALSELAVSELRGMQPLASQDNLDFGFSADDGPQLEDPVVRATARPVIDLEGGVTWERLTSGPEENVEFLHIRYRAGARSGAKMSRHNGREFTLVLEGELLLELGFESYLLKAGDSIVFDSTTPHRLSNAGQIPMHAITVIFRRG